MQIIVYFIFWNILNVYLHHTLRQSQLVTQGLTLLTVGSAMSPVEVSKLEYLEVAHLCPLALLLMDMVLQSLCLTPIWARTPRSLWTQRSLVSKTGNFLTLEIILIVFVILFRVVQIHSWRQRGHRWLHIIFFVAVDIAIVLCRDGGDRWAWPFRERSHANMPIGAVAYWQVKACSLCLCPVAWPHMGIKGTLYFEESSAEWAAQVVETQTETGSRPCWPKLSFSLSGSRILKPDLWREGPVCFTNPNSEVLGYFQHMYT